MSVEEAIHKRDANLPPVGSTRSKHFRPLTSRSLNNTRYNGGLPLLIVDEISTLKKKGEIRPPTPLNTPRTQFTNNADDNQQPNHFLNKISPSLGNNDPASLPATADRNVENYSNSTDPINRPLIQSSANALKPVKSKSSKLNLFTQKRCGSLVEIDPNSVLFIGRSLLPPQPEVVEEDRSNLREGQVEDYEVEEIRGEEEMSVQTRYAVVTSLQNAQHPQHDQDLHDEADMTITYKPFGWRQIFFICFCGLCQPRKTINLLSFWPPTPSNYEFHMVQPDETLVQLAPETAVSQVSQRKQRSRKTGDAVILMDKEFATDRIVFFLRLPYPIYSLTVDPFLIESASGNQIACLYVHCCNVGHAQRVVMHSHVNASDIGLELIHLQYSRLALTLRQCRCDIMFYDYSGYGMSGGKSSEKNLYLDGEAVLEGLKKRYKVPTNRIVLYGASIGSAPSIHLAIKNPQVGGLVLHSSIASAAKVAFGSCKNTIACFDAFRNFKKVSAIVPPTLFIHGTNDHVAKFKLVREMYQNCDSCVSPCWIEGGGHNDLEMFPAFYSRLSLFLTKEVAAI